MSHLADPRAPAVVAAAQPAVAAAAQPVAALRPEAAAGAALEQRPKRFAGACAAGR